MIDNTACNNDCGTVCGKPYHRSANINFDEIDLSKVPLTTEPARQYYFIARLREYVNREAGHKGRPLTAAVITFG